jgi:hypothetical protein
VVLVLTVLTLLIPAFALLFAPPVLTVWLLCFRTLPYHPCPKTRIHGFGRMLEPRYVLGARALDQ